MFHDFLHEHDIPVTRHDAHDRVGLNTRSFKSTHHTRVAAEEAHHNIRAQRERLGLPLVGAGTDVLKSYENLNGFIGSLLGIAQGLQYNPNAVSSACFSAVEGALIASDNGLSVLTKIYMPWYLSEAQLLLQDTIALQASFYTECEVNKFFNTMTHLVSAEGVSEMGARASGAFLFEYNTFKEERANPAASSFQKGTAFGRLFATIADYHI